MKQQNVWQAIVGWLLITLSCASWAAIPIKPQLQAKSWVLYDATSNQMLATENPDARLEPASLTKLMTAYLTFKAVDDGTLKMQQEVPVTEKAWKMEGSRMFIEPRRPVTVEELIKGMIVQSGNDATVALAEAIGGTEENFAQMMNQQAVRLGLKNTHYVNSTGMPAPDHYSSARDISILSAALIRDFPTMYKFYSLKEFQYNIPQPQKNRNRLLTIDADVDGIKTGYTEKAGFCLAASKKVGDRRLISVVMGADSDQLRIEESLKLLRFGFSQYETFLLYKRGTVIDRIPVYKGALNTLSVGYRNDFYVTLPRGYRDQMKVKLVRQHPLIAPVQVGQQVGKIRIELDDKPYVEHPVYALETVNAAGWIGRMIDTIRLWFS